MKIKYSLQAVALIFVMCFGAGQLTAQIRPQRPLSEIRRSFGSSVEGRQLIAYELGDGPNVTVVFGDFHGNERSVPGVVEKLHQYLRQHPESRKGCSVVLVPYANPDGWAYGKRVNAHGVDINRNFPGTWLPTGRAARYNPGPRAGSEPETQTIVKLVKHYKPTKIVSMHQPLHMMNWTGQPGLKLALSMQKYNHYRMSHSVGYPTPGSFGDYCGSLHIAIVTLELPNASVAECWKQNRDALLAAISLPL